jgi:hypothetical protein
MGKPQCNKDYLKGVQQQLDVMEKLRASGPELVGQICTLIEGGSALIGGELPDSLRQATEEHAGLDVTCASSRRNAGRPGSTWSAS